MQAINKNSVLKRICVCLLFFYSIHSSAQEYGLKFYGHDVTLDKRTELNLTPESFLEFEDEFEISFDIKMNIINRDNIFGYIFRIINKENYNVDLLSSPTPLEQFNIVVGKNNSVIPIENVRNIGNNWVNFRAKFFLSEDRLVFYTPDSFYVHEEIGFQTNDAFKIIFGANDFNQFKTTDVPSVSIKNIKIYEKGKLKYQWPLDLKKGNFTKDRIKGKEAFVKNPDWLMLSHQVWQTELDKEFEGYYLTAVDKNNEIIYFLGSKDYHVFSIEEQILITKKYTNEPFEMSSSYKAIYNNNDGRIYCYMTDDKHLSSFNIETGKWQHPGFSSNQETKHRHHNSYFDSINNAAYLFGGYGFHKYCNDVIKLDFKDNEIHNLPTNDSVFHPRYLAGLGAFNDTVYLFGGYGSETGNQLINPQSYYDLIGYSVKNRNFFKKFEIPRIIDDMAVANSMWIDPETRDFYALIFEKSLFNGYLQLIKGNLEKPEVEIRGDIIPFRFLDIRSYAGLLYAKKQNKLFAYSTYYSENDQTHLSVHSISYPPDQFNEEAMKNKSKGNKLMLIFVFMFVAFVTIYVFYKKNALKKKESAQILEKRTSIKQRESDALAEKTISKTDYQIIFFGGFQVFDKNYFDITNKFSPLLKELFLLITLYSFKNNKGISSEKITEILWFDKSEKSARNNRAVNIAKLRHILGEVGSCELTKKTGYWKLSPELSDIKTDYIDFLKITSSKTNLTKQKIQGLIKITEKGPFLHNLPYEWLDEFKDAVSEKIIDTLVDFAKSCDIKREAEFIIKVADSVFNFDIVNEDAMILKCRAEYLLGKHGLAKSTYEKFFKEYQTMYGQEYERAFVEILEIKE